jgi:pyruvate-formate lyase-activating enzyme
LELSILAVDPLERYEICDGCGSRSMPYSTFFDGNKFLCSTCNAAREAAGIGESLKG